MLFREKRLQARMIYVVLSTLAWLSFGGHIWAQQTAARNNPRAFLERLADDPRLSLTPDVSEFAQRVENTCLTTPRGLYTKAQGKLARSAASPWVRRPPGAQLRRGLYKRSEESRYRTPSGFGFYNLPTQGGAALRASLPWALV